LIGRIRMLAQGDGMYIPAIALTGYTAEQEGERALAAGFQMYLTKPTEPEKLVEAIASLVGDGEKRQGV
jgi:CheY-like chemotaxis protein